METVATPAVAASGQRAGDQAHAWGRSIAQSVALVGSLDSTKVDYARRLLEQSGFRVESCEVIGQLYCVAASPV